MNNINESVGIYLEDVKSFTGKNNKFVGYAKGVAGKNIDEVSLEGNEFIGQVSEADFEELKRIILEDVANQLDQLNQGKESKLKGMVGQILTATGSAALVEYLKAKGYLG
ncbi:hypothetical protein P4V72_20485 [Bacillus thuringiensis]|uniref:Uncharacterized protein n=1 Tax=Bacillus thuringiensis TaxID=1428 RepID=A0A9W3T947_BACTU|nr:hypothetical protein [Bacillus thuringiensis]AQY37008.1 hypothetical protein B4918_02855 [Bacillus thuringiensis]MDR4148762.1 hypothetical protein [Bacillus thuringiensis]MEC3570982.1 hypothetical protein [Bacillus thuringiensis]MED2018536.1 hypothetical protein [Bacillus thuringiensis]MED2143530.1 hypothetical protein [Bacillus thuringiensis]